MQKSLRRDGIVVPAHLLQRTQTASSLFNFPVAPGSFSRILTIADSWAEFRVNSLKFRLHPETNTSGGGVAAGLYTGIADTPPASISNVMELIPSAFLGYNSTVPSNWIDVPQKDLRGYFSWYKTIIGSPDVDVEHPCFIQVVTSGTMDLFALEIYCEFEFKGAISTSNTPEEIALRNKLRELKVKKVALKGNMTTVAPYGQSSQQTVVSSTQLAELSSAAANRNVVGFNGRTRYVLQE